MILSAVWRALMKERPATVSIVIFVYMKKSVSNLEDEAETTSSSLSRDLNVNGACTQSSASGSACQSQAGDSSGSLQCKPNGLGLGSPCSSTPEAGSGAVKADPCDGKLLDGCVVPRHTSSASVSAGDISSDKSSLDGSSATSSSAHLGFDAWLWESNFNETGDPGGRISVLPLSCQGVGGEPSPTQLCLMPLQTNLQNSRKHLELAIMCSLSGPMDGQSVCMSEPRTC